MLATFCSVPEEDGESLNTVVFAVDLDEFIEDGFRIVPLPGIQKAEGCCKARPNAERIASNE